MKVLLFLFMALIFPLKILADDFDEDHPGRYDAARMLVGEFLVRYAPGVEEAIRHMDKKIKEVTRYSADLVYRKHERKLLIETIDPDDRVLDPLRRGGKSPPLLRWEARGNFEYVKGGLELNLSKTFAGNAKVALRGMATQEFFEPFDPELMVQAKVTFRF